MHLSYQSARLLPIVIFVSVWTLQAVLYNISPFTYTPISTQGWLLITVSVALVAIGYLTRYFFDTGRQITPSKYHRSEHALVFDEAHFKKIYSILIVLVTIGAVGKILFLAYQIRAHGLDVTNIFWFRYFLTSYIGGELEWSPINSLFSYLLTLNEVVLVLSGIYFCFFPRKRIYLYLPVVISISYSIITLQRYGFISSIVIWYGSIFFMSFFLKTEDHKRALKQMFKTMFVMLGVVVGMLLGIILIRTNINLGGATLDKLLYFAAQNIYSYFSGNIVALDQYIRSDVDFYNGSHVLASFLKWFERFGLISANAVPDKYLEFTKVGTGLHLNTYTYIRAMYSDFGWYSVTILSYFWGFISAQLTHALYRRFTLQNLMFASFFTFALFLSFFGLSVENLTKLILLYVLAKIIDTQLRYEEANNATS